VCRLQCTCREVCGLRVCGRRSAVIVNRIRRLTANGFLIQRSRCCAVTMNSVKILHAVRSAVTAIAELLVLKDHNVMVLLLELRTFTNLLTCLIKPAGTYLLKCKAVNIVYITSYLPTPSITTSYVNEVTHLYPHSPHCVYNLFRFSFVNRCLFKYF